MYSENPSNVLQLVSWVLSWEPRQQKTIIRATPDQTKKFLFQTWIIKLTRLSLSFGGSWGSVGLGGGGSPLDLGGGGDGSFFASLIGAVSGLGATCSFSLEGDGWLAGFSDGAAFGAPSPDLEMAATLMPGSTVSPSFAKSYYQLYRDQYKQSRITDMSQTQGINNAMCPKLLP